MDNIEWNNAMNRAINVVKDQLQPHLAEEQNLELHLCCKLQLNALIKRLEEMTIKEELFKYKVKLTYFKPAGKYYSQGEYQSKYSDLDDIWDEVRYMQGTRHLPGLTEGCSEFTVLIEVPGHPHDHPRLIV